MLRVSYRNLEKTTMIQTLNASLMALIAILMGILGSYLTKWEKDIYQRYFRYILPPVALAAVFFMFVDQTTSETLFFILILGLTWMYSTKFWFEKK